MRILAIESSCDETAMAILSENGKALNLETNLVNSQIDIHKQYGGVVPEVASRQHLQNIIPLLEETLGKDKLSNIDYLAVTSGPGLISSLLLGVTVAKSLSFASNKPLIASNHIEGHVYSNWPSNPELFGNEEKYFPSLSLVVSGGHTELVLIKGHGDYQLLGCTLDDAVGEAFDKVAKLLSLGYPGGPIVSKLAETGNDKFFDLPRPMINSGDYNFSFSGIKTAVLYALEKIREVNKKDIANMCASFQTAVTDVLVQKTIKAAKEYDVNSILLSGGVSANKVLRERLSGAAESAGIKLFYPELKYTGDNAAMIAVAAYYNLKNNKARIFTPSEVGKLQVEPNWQLSKR